MMPMTMVQTCEIVPSFLDNPEKSLSSLREIEIGNMISAKSKMASFMAVVYASLFCVTSMIKPSHVLFVYCHGGLRRLCGEDLFSRL